MKEEKNVSAFLNRAYIIKAIVLIAIILMVTSSLVMLGACKEKEPETPTIEKLEVSISEEASFKVGDTFSSSSFNFIATMSDGTTVTPSTTSPGFVYETESLKLDSSSKYTTPGEYTLRIVYLNTYEMSVQIVVTE